MKVCILIADGIGIRNYLYSDLLVHLSKAGHEIVIWHNLDEKVIREAENLHQIKIESYPFKMFSDPFHLQLTREATTYARLLNNIKLTGNHTLILNWFVPSKKFFKRRKMMQLAQLLGKKIKSYESIKKWENKINSWLTKTDSYYQSKKDLKSINPDLLFCSHQRVSPAASAALAASDLGIKTATAIFSWDNLPKARLPIRADRYFVWSDYMKREVELYYPEIDSNQIKVTGTPQFDFYAKKDLIKQRVQFAEDYGLDPNKNWICFSGDDIRTSPNDHEYLEDIARELSVDPSIQIIFRQVPVEGVERYKEVMDKYENIIHINPLWEKGLNWNSFFPYPADIQLLMELAYHCDAVLNIGSTMALDFSIYDKPGIYLNYDHHTTPEWTVKDIYQFQHFKSMEGMSAVGWVNNVSEILKVVKETISHDPQIAKDRKKWFNRIVQPHQYLTAAERIVDEIETLAGIKSELHTK